MAATDNARLEEIFLAALAIVPEERAAFLDTECRDNTALRERVTDLLVTAEQADRYFHELSNRLGAGALAAGLAPQSGPAQELPADQCAGTEIGGYRLLRELGRGGMASVWLAERIDGLIQRPVALKFPHGAWLMPGLAERMKQERDILAQLNHPNIARLYDAGLTTDGRPYLALEYVEGAPIDQFCERHQLSVRQRLDLLLQVSRAVAHAHAMLVVHRDLKPSNVLVTSSGEVRLLDFGIAKLLAQDTAASTSLTAHSGRALTVDYASPEQILGQPITIASDVYSLGVLAFELLTGERPYRLSRESRGAMEDAILQADPLRPSQLAPETRRRELRGDLDTILLKALKKSPQERYETVNAFIDDIERHRAARPVLARPDTLWYRAGRLVARNRLAVGALTLTLMAIVGGAALALVQAHVAERERARAEDINAFITSMLQRTDPYQDEGESLTGAELLRRAREDLTDRFLEFPDRRAQLLNVIGSGFISVGELDEAQSTLQQALGESRRAFGGSDPYSVLARVLMAEVMNTRRDLSATETAVRELLPAARAHLETHPEILVRTLILQTSVAIERGRYDVMREPVREALAIAEARLGRSHRLTYAARSLLAESHVIQADSIDDMLSVTGQLLEQTVALHPQRPDHAQIIRMREIHARALGVAGRIRESVEQSRAARTSLLHLFGPDSPMVASSATNMAPYERRLGELEESLSSSNTALRIFEGRMDRRSRDFANFVMTRGVTYLSARRVDPAIEDLREARDTFAEIAGPTHWDTLTAALNLAVGLAYRGQIVEAQKQFVVLDDPAVKIQYPWWVQHQRGIVARLAGDYGLAMQSQRAALSLIPPGERAPWDRVRALAELGLAEHAAGAVAEAADTLRQAQSTFETLRIAMHPAFAETLTARGALLLEADMPSAVALLSRAAEYWEQRDPRNAAGAEAAYWLAICYQRLGRAEEAARQRARAVALLAGAVLPWQRELRRRLGTP